MIQPSDTPKTSGRSRSPVAAHPVTSAVIAILILASIFFALYVPLYAKRHAEGRRLPVLLLLPADLHAGARVVMWIVITLQHRLRRRPGAEGAAAAGDGEVTR